ncbi:P-type conjugative transfer ATPase TrbB [Facilibium subflavum]|uniref:P-type conjugative transfer ATPase TrbB n=1 Tax=Facilibium subflavum TaxID=2219058 RepID=UPI000E648828|nr:P-type conjugative transfer ATPase TrbB [Facilibium subflavum]
MIQQGLIKDRQLRMLETAFGQQMMEYLYDPQIIEVMLNPDGRLHYERIGEGKVATDTIISAEQSENILKLVASFKNQVANEEHPEVSTELPFEGARFQGWLPPVVSQACFSIRRRAVAVFTLDQYVEQGALTLNQADFLKNAVKLRKNIVIVGGTGSGKTTFANALLAELSGDQDRILVIEDLPELQVKVEDLVSMTTTSHISMRDLVKGSLRMRPDRIIIGEVRDGSALDLLKAWNTGHPGGVCTIHANSVESTPHRFEDLIQEAVVSVPKTLILQALDLIVFIQRDKSGKRKITDMVELSGYDKGEYILTPCKI